MTHANLGTSNNPTLYVLASLRYCPLPSYSPIVSLCFSGSKRVQVEYKRAKKDRKICLGMLNLIEEGILGLG